jgi:spermidine synthase
MVPILITAFLEGLCVLVVEIAGARALAPFFGTSLHVWTATITATLLFLAVGYGFGGRLCQRGPMALPGVFWAAGGWLVLYPFWRTMLLSSLTSLGVSFGAFMASAWLFGPPLTCLGAVSPLLIQRLGREGFEGGQAAGALFFTNTLGGLAGGWLTALVLVPMLPLRYVLAGTGALLVLMGGVWARRQGSQASLLLIAGAGVALVSMAPGPRKVVPTQMPDAPQVRVTHRAQSPTGLVQVLEVPGQWRQLLIDGVNQGGMDMATGASLHPVSDYLAIAVHRYHPAPRSALLLGLGCGVLAKTLYGMGMRVDVAEIEPEVVSAARQFFDLPAGVNVATEDGRTYLSSHEQRYDVVVLDVFAGENSPWYLLTREALEAVRARLNPGGRMVVNSVTQASGESEGLKRLEATLLAVFGEALVFTEPRLPNEGELLVNATLVAGKNLVQNDRPYRGIVSRANRPFIGDFNGTPLRPARAGARIDTDDHSSLEMVEAEVRLRWRESVIGLLGPDILQD